MKQKKQNEMTSEATAWTAWLTEAKRLRALSSEAEADFLGHLQRGEEERDLWRGTGYGTFAELLHGEHLCETSRYLAFKAAVAQIGFEKVREVGVFGARLVLPIPVAVPSRRDESKSAVDAIIADMTEFRTKNATPPSEQQARAIRDKHWDPPTRVRTTVDERIAALEAENKALKKEVRDLRRENARLKTELGGTSAAAE